MGNNVGAIILCWLLAGLSLSAQQVVKGDAAEIGTVGVTSVGPIITTSGTTGQQSLESQNTAAGTGNSAALTVASDTASAGIITYSSTFTPALPRRTAGTILQSTGVGGMTFWLNSNTAPAFYWYTGAGGGAGPVMALYQDGGLSLKGAPSDPGTDSLNIGGSVFVNDNLSISGGLYMGIVGGVTDSSSSVGFSGFGTGASINGLPFAFVVTAGSSALGTTGTVTMGVTYGHAIVCTVSTNSATVSAYIGSTTTSQVIIDTTATMTAGMLIFGQCRGY